MTRIKVPHDFLTLAGLAREAIVLVISFATAITLWLRRRSARYWPTVYGRVEHASCWGDTVAWQTDISYSYRVAEEFYSGRIQLKSTSERKADDDVARWKDRNIVIRYSPHNPEISVVRVEDQAALYSGEFVGH
jgi:hypothetical protein